eukprot:6938974-Lingulodinium_polyedra.AAC.1
MAGVLALGKEFGQARATAGPKLQRSLFSMWNSLALVLPLLCVCCKAGRLGQAGDVAIDMLDLH